MTKVRLVFGRTESDNVNLAWTGIKSVVIELPFENDGISFDKWQLLGAEWIDDPQDAKGEAI